MRNRKLNGEMAKSLKGMDQRSQGGKMLEGNDEWAVDRETEIRGEAVQCRRSH